MPVENIMFLWLQYMAHMLFSVIKLMYFHISTL